MTRTTIPALAALALVAAIFGLPAEAAQPARVKAVSCRALPASASWWTVFYGERRDFWDRRWTYHRAVCFRSVKDCRAWLYWAQSDWPEMNGHQGCNKGKP